MCPTEPPTTTSMPFIEIPQRELASSSMTSSPPQPEAPAAWPALPVTRTEPDIMFSATPGPACPLTLIEARLFIPPQ